MSIAALAAWLFMPSVTRQPLLLFARPREDEEEG
jgi:hypothetical protein